MWYATAKVNYQELIEDKNLITTCIIFRKMNDQIEVLLERRGTKPNKHGWCIPGGHVEFGENPDDAIIREIAEETNLKLDVSKIKKMNEVAAKSKNYKHNIIYFTIINKDKNVKAGSDAEHLEWFNVKNMPVLLWDNEKFIKKALHKIKL